MPHIPEALSVGTDWRLLGCAYVKFFVTRDYQNQRLLERPRIDLSVSIGRLAVAVAEEIYFPRVFGVEPHCSYRAVDRLRQRDSGFDAAWNLRRRYRRQSLGLTLCSVSRSRQVAADIATMLCNSWAHLHCPDDTSVLVCDIVPTMLSDLCTRLCRSSEHPTDP